jgi:hypothetical protein
MADATFDSVIDELKTQNSNQLSYSKELSSSFDSIEFFDRMQIANSKELFELEDKRHNTDLLNLGATVYNWRKEFSHDESTEELSKKFGEMNDKRQVKMDRNLSIIADVLIDIRKLFNNFSGTSLKQADYKSYLTKRQERKLDNIFIEVAASGQDVNEITVFNKIREKALHEEGDTNRMARKFFTGEIKEDRLRTAERMTRLRNERSDDLANATSELNRTPGKTSKLSKAGLMKGGKGILALLAGVTGVLAIAGFLELLSAGQFGEKIEQLKKRFSEGKALEYWDNFTRNLGEFIGGLHTFALHVGDFLGNTLLNGLVAISDTFLGFVSFIDGFFGFFSAKTPEEMGTASDKMMDGIKQILIGLDGKGGIVNFLGNFVLDAWKLIKNLLLDYLVPDDIKKMMGWNEVSMDTSTQQLDKKSVPTVTTNSDTMVDPLWGTPGHTGPKFIKRNSVSEKQAENKKLLQEEYDQDKASRSDAVKNYQHNISDSSTKFTYNVNEKPKAKSRSNNDLSWRTASTL